MDNINIPDIHGIQKKNKICMLILYLLTLLFPIANSDRNGIMFYREVLILFQRTGTKSMYITQFLKLL